MINSQAIVLSSVKNKQKETLNNKIKQIKEQTKQQSKEQTKEQAKEQTKGRTKEQHSVPIYCRPHVFYFLFPSNLGRLCHGVYSVLHVLNCPTFQKLSYIVLNCPTFGLF